MKNRGLLLLLSHMDPKNNSTQIKPPQTSSITCEENEEIHNKLFKLEDQLND
jgi:hypothetical protein